MKISSAMTGVRAATRAVTVSTATAAMLLSCPVLIPGLAQAAAVAGPVPVASSGTVAGAPPRITTAGTETRAFALVVGVNRGRDPGITPLRYADDDAVRFGDLFRAVGARVVVLGTLDQNTSRIHPAAAAEAVPARLSELTRAVDRLAGEVARAHRAGQRTTFYFAYAGHGRVEASSDSGTIALEDDELRGSDILARIIDRVRADESHVIVDACNSYFLVLGRGPGGRRRPLDGFARLGALAERRDVGLLLSTSSARDSHEWAAFQAGVFSQEVRSGLYGAADADNDGTISYSEIGAFVSRANDGVRNERYRPDLFARAPMGKGTLLDLRAALLARRIEIAPGGGHQFIEDTLGVRLADFHNGAPVRLVRPGEGRLYLRRTSDDREYVLPAELSVLQTAALTLQEPRSSARNAANDAFAALFSAPFSTAALSEYQSHPAGDLVVEATPPPEQSFWSRPRNVAGGSLAAVGVAAGAWGIVNLVQARTAGGAADPSLSQQDAAMINENIAAKNRRGGLLLVGGAAAALGGALLLLWPERQVDISASEQAVLGTWRGRF